MLYCIQVEPAEEIKTEKEIRAIVPGHLFVSCFHLTRRMHKNFHGRYRDVIERFLPSYIFIDTPDLEPLYWELKKVPTLTKVVGFKEWEPAENGFSGFGALDEEEEGFIRQLAMGHGAATPGLVDISMVEVKEGNTVEIVSGPLMGLEGYVKKINLHRRQAEVELTLFRQKHTIYLGIEIMNRVG
ncbi:MAG: KOW motif-containing protein [Lachnospiraceae bacterium]|nr:KOW motif-containing protein [Lachnospiraceae bacterium]